jgi:hypothetical protein
MAQSIPNGSISQGQQWTIQQWNQAWQSKQDVLTYTPLKPQNNLSDVANVAQARANLGIGSSGVVNTGTSGAAVCLLNTACTYSALQTFQAGINTSSITGLSQPLSTAVGGIGTSNGDISSLTATSNGASAAASLAAHFARQIWVTDFDPNACSSATYDSSAAFNAASQWMSAHGPGVILVPNGICKLGNSTYPTLTLGNGVSLVGRGPWTTFIYAGLANANPLIRMGGNGNTIANLQINAAAAGTNTSGTTIQMGIPGSPNTVFSNELISNIVMAGPCIGVDMNGNQVQIQNSYINGTSGTGCGGIRVGTLTTFGGTVAAEIVNTAVASSKTTPADFGLQMLDSGGGYVLNGDFLYSKIGTELTPGTNQYVQWNVFGHTAMGDTNTTYALYVNPTTTNAYVLGTRFDSDWAATNGSGDLISIQNSNGGTVTDLDFSNLYAVNTHGSSFTLGPYVSNVSIGGSSKLCAYGTSGITLQGGASNFHLVGSSVVPTCMNHNNGGSYGINFGGSNNQLVITGNDFTGNLASTPFTGNIDGPNTIVFADNIAIDNNAPNLGNSAFSGGTLDLSAAGTVSPEFPTFYYTGSSGITVAAFAHPGWQGRTFRILNVSGGTITLGNGTSTGYYIAGSPLSVSSYGSASCYFTGVYAICH